MIVEPTVLVLGAGASAPYGFPTGRKLLLDLCASLESEGSSLSNNLLSCGIRRDRQKVFRDDLFFSMQPSVDTFLEKRPYFLEIGKAALSCALIPYERLDHVNNRTSTMHWYEYLFSKMNSGWDEFGENNISFVTFNYDRSLEQFLFNALTHSFGKDEAETGQLLRKIPIIHVHGQLGKYPAINEGAGRPYSQTVNPEIVSQCIQEIKILHEGVDNELFSEARKLLLVARKVCFLGFGYHEINLERVCPWKTEKISDHTELFGSAFGLIGAEERKVRTFFQQNYKRNILLGRCPGNDPPSPNFIDVTRLVMGPPSDWAGQLRASIQKAQRQRPPLLGPLRASGGAGDTSWNLSFFKRLNEISNSLRARLGLN